MTSKVIISNTDFTSWADTFYLSWCPPRHWPPQLYLLHSCLTTADAAPARALYRGQVISWVKGSVCFVFEISTPSHCFPSPLCGGSFKTKQALNLWPNQYLDPCNCRCASRHWWRCTTITSSRRRRRTSSRATRCSGRWSRWVGGLIQQI